MPTPSLKPAPRLRASPNGRSPPKHHLDLLQEDGCLSAGPSPHRSRTVSTLTHPYVERQAAVSTSTSASPGARWARPSLGTNGRFGQLVRGGAGGGRGRAAR